MWLHRNMLFFEFFQGKLAIRNLSPHQWLMLLQCLISLISVPAPPDTCNEFSPKVSPAESRTYNLQSSTYIPIQTDDKRLKVGDYFIVIQQTESCGPKCKGHFLKPLVKQLLNHISYISLQDLLITRNALLKTPMKWD